MYKPHSSDFHANHYYTASDQGGWASHNENTTAMTLSIAIAITINCNQGP